MQSHRLPVAAAAEGLPPARDGLQLFLGVVPLRRARSHPSVLLEHAARHAAVRAIRRQNH